MAFDAEPRTGVANSDDFPQAFDPIAFFRGPTVGHAVARAPGGRLLKRCRLETFAEESAEHGALHFDERYMFEGGEPDVMHWAVTRTPQGLEAKEVSVIGAARSQLQGAEWRVRFRRRARPPADGPTLLYDARFNLVAEDLVLKTVRVSLLGVTLATLSGHHRRVHA